MSSEDNLQSAEISGATSETEAPSSYLSPGTSEATESGTRLADLGELARAPGGQIVAGTVVKVTDTEVLVDVGLKSEGTIPIQEFKTEDGRLTVSPGDVVDIWIERYDEQEGTVTLSRQKAARLKLWEEVEQAFQDQRTVKGRVVERIKGGLIVDLGVRAFLPGSHADVRPLRNLESLLGQEISCKVIKIIRKRNNAVVSRKLALEEELNRRKAELAEKLQEGAELVGRVKNITNYGAFLDLGGLDGLLHVADLAWGRVAHPSELVQVGQELRVKVLKYDAAKGRVSLGLKQLAPNPWELVPSKYHVGDRVSGRVVSVTDYGAFVELEPGVEGLIHVSEMTWSRRPKHPSKIVKVGERAEVAVLDVKPGERRISLSLKQVMPDPWATLAERLKAGAVVDAWVRSFAEFGAFAEVEEGVDGLIHISDLSWAKKVKHPSEVLRKGQVVKAVVLSLDPVERRLSLGLKQLEADPWTSFDSRIKVGDLVRGKVTRLAPFGAFVDLGEGVEGLCHNSEFGDVEGFAGAKKLEMGSERKFRVIRLNARERKIGLSLKNGEEAPVEVRKEKLPENDSTMAQALSSAGLLPPRPSSLARVKSGGAEIDQEPHA